MRRKPLPECSRRWSRVRKAALTAHVVCSVGWLGAVVGSLALAIAGLITDDQQRMRGIYLALEVTGGSRSCR